MRKRKKYQEQLNFESENDDEVDVTNNDFQDDAPTDSFEEPGNICNVQPLIYCFSSSLHTVKAYPQNP